MLVSSLLATALSSLFVVQAYFIEPANHLQKRAKLQECTNSYSTFTDSIGNWVLERGSSRENYETTPDGLKIMILPPAEHEPLMDTKVKPALPYNKYVGKGFTFNATTYMQYGKFTATLKSANVPGAVTAVILMADNGDEIDYEILVGGEKPITSNYFWGGNITYGVNGDSINPPGAPACDDFYSYTINWSPEEIVWSINGKEIRTHTRKKSYKDQYPTGAARVQIGLWDGSGASGTAQWAHGPINWDTQKEPIAAYIKDVKIECDPKYNQVKN